MKRIDKWSGYYLKKYRLLTKILDGNSDWSNKCTEAKNLEAREALVKFYNEYKKCRPDRKYCASTDFGYFSYLTYIDPVRQALVDRLYQRACNETYSLLHYDYFLQKRIMNSLLSVLEENLDIKSRIEMKGTNCKKESIDIKSLLNYISDDSEQGYYVGNGNANGELVTIDIVDYKNRNREHPVDIFIGKVGKGKGYKIPKMKNELNIMSNSFY
ncbi:hypothetical protein [Ruminiclostridium josui]|nr:hypothetical protein [Ruminiclostridium josui]